MPVGRKALVGAAYLAPVDLVRPLVPEEFEIVPVLPGRTLATVFVADYGPGSTLEYHEFGLQPALVRFRGVTAAWNSLLLVDSPASVRGGRTPRLRQAVGRLRLARGGRAGRPGLGRVRRAARGPRGRPHPLPPGAGAAAGRAGAGRHAAGRHGARLLEPPAGPLPLVHGRRSSPRQGGPADILRSPRQADRGGGRDRVSGRDGGRPAGAGLPAAPQPADRIGIERPAESP